jgi:hypothetical protein
MSAEVALGVWGMMDKHNCLPDNPKFLHKTLAFMQLYPKNDKALSTSLGGSDPETIRKYIWPIINSMFVLDSEVVSFYCSDFFVQ